MVYWGRKAGAGRVPANGCSGRGGRELAVLALGLLAACDSTAPELPPGAPGAVTAVTALEQRTTVAWALPIAEVTTIELERSQNGGPFTPSARGDSQSIQPIDHRVVL